MSTFAPVLGPQPTPDRFPAGATAIAQKLWSNVAPGTYIVRVAVDPNNTVFEGNEVNNVSDFRCLISGVQPNPDVCPPR